MTGQAPTEPDLNGHHAIVANVCYDCQGKLRDDTGTFSERLVEVSSTQAFAAAICNTCKAKQRAAKVTCPNTVEDGPDTYRCELAPKHRGKCQFVKED